MRINKIRLHNISSYLGTFELDFSVTGEQKIVLVGGQNGTGKTSLFTAIKLALYGPLCFGFQSNNNQYTARIKELISHDAFARTEVFAWIELEISLPQGQALTQYTIRREWVYKNKKLSERDTVHQEGKMLSSRDLDYFWNYINTILPPNLFDFFFFDGEEIAGFFASSNYNAYLRNAILTIESYDNFALIEKYCHRFVGSAADTAQYQSHLKEFEKICDELDCCEDEKEARMDEINALLQKDVQLEQQRLDLENRFSRMGGGSKSERTSLESALREREQIRERINASLKNFIENLMPIVLTAPMADQLKLQLIRENQMQQYRTIAEQISPSFLQSELADVIQEFRIEEAGHFSETLSRALLCAVMPDIDIRSFRFMHDLSEEQKSSVQYALSELDHFDFTEIVKQIRAKEQTAQEITSIRRALGAALSEEEIATFENQLNAITRERAQTQLLSEKKRQEFAAYETYIENLHKRHKALKATLAGLTRKVNAEQYTQKIGEMMEELMSSILKIKREKIEEETLRLTREIFRKEQFIDHIELDEQFNFSLFREQIYTYRELAALLKNMGNENLTYRIGEKGVLCLKEYFQVSSDAALRKRLKSLEKQMSLYDTERIALYKRIEFQQLSKGEKQIFILSLYWAIIGSAQKDIPFIIDTPYARIDMEHRAHITKKFFPSISDQVIIFSTDEEITRQYYKALKPYISREYTLQYNEKENRTEVVNGYLFKEII